MQGIQLDGIQTTNSNLAIAVNNAWNNLYRYHANGRAKDAVIQINASSVELEAANKITYFISTGVQSLLEGILCFSDIYRSRHDGLSRPSVPMIMQHDHTQFDHGFMQLALDTEIAPKIAIQLKGDNMQRLVSPMELIISANLLAYKRLRDYCKADALSNTSDEARQIAHAFAKEQVKTIRNFAKHNQEKYDLNYGLIDQISKEYKHDLGYKVSVLGQKGRAKAA
jgi:hypothetical protein